MQVLCPTHCTTNLVGRLDFDVVQFWFGSVLHGLEFEPASGLCKSFRCVFHRPPEKSSDCIIFDRSVGSPALHLYYYIY